MSSASMTTPIQQIWAGVAAQNPDLRVFAEMPTIARTATLAGAIVKHDKTIGALETGIASLDTRLVKSSKELQQLEALLGCTRNEVALEVNKLAELKRDYNNTTTQMSQDLHQVRIDIGNTAFLTQEQQKRVNEHVVVVGRLLTAMSLLESKIKDQQNALNRQNEESVASKQMIVDLRADQQNLRNEMNLHFNNMAKDVNRKIACAVGFTLAMGVIVFLVVRRQHLQLAAKVKTLENKAATSASDALKAVSSATVTSSFKKYNSELFKSIMVTANSRLPSGLIYYVDYAADRIKNQGATSEQVVIELVDMLAYYKNFFLSVNFSHKTFAVTIVDLIQNLITPAEFVHLIKIWCNLEVNIDASGPLIRDAMLVALHDHPFNAK